MPLLRRHLLRVQIAGAILALGLIASSCGEGTATAPSPAAVVEPAQAPSSESHGGLGDVLQNVGLLSCRPMAPARGSAVIGPEGGVVVVGPHTLTVPRGALDRRVRITGYAPRSNVNVVEFEPHGINFDRPASLTLSYANCNLLGRLVPKHVAYVGEDLEIFYLLRSVDDVLNQRVTGRVDHFSEYAVAW